LDIQLLEDARCAPELPVANDIEHFLGAGDCNIQEVRPFSSPTASTCLISYAMVFAIENMG